jgi:hypothetical protein
MIFIADYDTETMRRTSLLALRTALGNEALHSASWLGFYVYLPDTSTPSSNPQPSRARMEDYVANHDVRQSIAKVRPRDSSVVRSIDSMIGRDEHASLIGRINRNSVDRYVRKVGTPIDKGLAAVRGTEHMATLKG